MNKFTIFTVVLAVVVVAVASQMVSDKYLPTLKTSTFDIPEASEEVASPNKLGADIQYEEPVKVEELSTDSGDGADGGADDGADLSDQIPFEGGEPADETVAVKVAPKVTVDSADFEDPNFSFSAPKYTPNVYLSEEQVQSAGFKDATLEKEESDGFLYKTVYVSDLFDVVMEKVAVKSGEELMARVYVFKVGPNSKADEVVNVLKLRADDLKGVEVNETNEFGDRSFYMNDSGRASTVFLTVKFGSMIYGFSYPKDYHSQIKNLIKLLSWEFGRGA